ncbi:MAG TPA: dihydrolipoamide acetyltransferase family protein, partial [Thermodesulfobacteriota bacterium]|nr:dihydrolipoamide acetyltransferase family protein [Thermodesulfobacteriota bacterium]
AAPAAHGAPGAGGGPATTAVWRVMAERVTRSWTTVPHFYLLREVRAEGLVRWRQALRARLADGVTYTDLLVKALAAALREHPELNATWEGDALVRQPEVNVAIAVATEEGLLAPVIHRADRLDVAAIARHRQELVGRAQAGRLAPEDVRGGTFTLSNLGMYGVDAFTAIINPPQVAILAAGRIAERVLPVDGRPTVAPVLTLSLGCDHRAVDGARAARFLDTLARLLAEPPDAGG